MTNRNLEKTIAFIVSAFAIVTFWLLLTKNTYNELGYEHLYILPGLFAVYYPLGKLSKVKLRNLPVTMLRLTLILRVVITPFYMVITDTYSAGFYARTPVTTSNERTVATFLFLYEIVAIVLMAEYCIRKYGIDSIDNVKTDEVISKTLKPMNRTILCWVAAFIGIIGYLIYPAISQRVYFVIANDFVTYEYMSAVPALFFEFTKIVFLVLLLISVNNALKQKQRSLEKRPSIFSGLWVLLFAFMLIAMRMSNNRMNIVRNTLFCLELLILVYPKRKKTILVGLGILCFIVFMSVSAYKWLGQTSVNMDVNIISTTFGEGGEAKFLQMYFNGVDGIAYGVALKESMSISFRVFINDTLRNVVFLNQFITGGNTLNTSILYNHYIYGNASSLGAIIPMVTQCSMHLGYFLSPLYSSICVYMLFYACKKRLEAKSFYQFFFWFGIALEFGSFQGYNYSLVIANIANNVLLPYFIMRVSSRVVLRVRYHRI